jgi:hypothetical protein
MPFALMSRKRFTPSGLRHRHGALGAAPLQCVEGDAAGVFAQDADQVDGGVAALEAGAHRGLVRDVPGNALDGCRPSGSLVLAAGTGQDANLMAVRQRVCPQVAADESGAANDADRSCCEVRDGGEEIQPASMD